MQPCVSPSNASSYNRTTVALLCALSVFLRRETLRLCRTLDIFRNSIIVLPRLNKTELLDEDTCPDLGEQLRAVFLRLKQRCAQLPKPSEPRSFMIGMEPKDDAKDSPWQDPWIMVEHSTGKTGKKTVPIYSVQDKWLCFDVWVRNLQKLEQGE
jgi:hypothetical protein